MSRYDEYVQRQKAKYGDKFSDADLCSKFRSWFNSGVRVRVEPDYGMNRTGTIGVTTGSRPAFLLMSRSNAIGSSDVLSERDNVVASKSGRTYVPVVGKPS